VSKSVKFRLYICIFAPAKEVTQSLAQLLSGDRYDVHLLENSEQFLSFVEKHKEQIDCVIVLKKPAVIATINQLYGKGILLPVIIIEEETELESAILYHSGEIPLSILNLETITVAIDQAMTQFLHLGPSCPISDHLAALNQENGDNPQTFLLLQQRRLAEKLKERLGYLGVYYKRNPQYFYRNLSQPDKQELLAQLNLEYRQIIFNYFLDDVETNQAIDQFVNRAFFADISVSQILEMHMELMDEFSQQLKLEGRSEEILLDYRLALIDIIAHLCEMYRRSIPREDLPFDVLFHVD
jgi:circadian clock protein KaiA